MSDEKNLALIFLALVAVIALVGFILVGNSNFRITGKAVDEISSSDNGNAVTGQLIRRQTTKPTTVPTAGGFGKSCCTRGVKGFIDKSGNCRATKGRC